jgi:ABC-type sulfate transport system permease subunit
MTSSTRLTLTTVLTIVFTVLTIVTAIWPTWIESLFEASPDGGSGTLEMLIALPFGLAAVVSGLLAHRARQATRPAVGDGP